MNIKFFREFILTAGHCCEYRDPESFTVVVGEHDRSTTDLGQRSRSVSKVIIHPSFTSTTLNNDFCLLQLSSKLEWSETVYPVCLPKTCDDECTNSGSGQGDYIMITGWGTTQEEGSSSRILQKARVPMQNRVTCTKNYEAEDVTITDQMICAGYSSGGIDACQGDSGGPMVCPKWGFFQQDGVTSFGLGCARPNLFGVYSRVCTAIEWIDYTIGKYKMSATTTTPSGDS